MLTVFGSINLDISVCSSRLPQPGETHRRPHAASRFMGAPGCSQALIPERAARRVVQ